MEAAINQVSSNDLSQQVAGVTSLLNSPQLISKLSSRILLKALKKSLSQAKIETTPIILQLLSKLLDNDSITSIFSDIFPELFLVASDKTLKSYSSVISLLSDYFLKTTDSKSILSFLIVTLNNKENIGIRIITLTIIKDIYKLININDELYQALKKISNDSKDYLKSNASEILEVVDLYNPCGKKNNGQDKDLQFSYRIIEKIEAATSWEEKLVGLQWLEEVLSSLDSLISLQEILPSFIAFLCKMFEDTNFKISISCLNIAFHLFLSPDIAKSSELGLLIPYCIIKLGDNKISVRLNAHKVIRKIISYNIERAINELMIALDNNNWHIREESVICLIVAMLTRQNDHDYLKLIPSLSKMLDDERTKIKIASTEALAVISSFYGVENVLKKLEKIIDAEAFKEINERFSQKFLPILDDEYVTFSKKTPRMYRIISSPYLIASSSPIGLKQINTTTNSLCIDKNVPDTPTSADTFSPEPKLLNKKFPASKSLKTLSSLSLKVKLRSSLENEITPIYLSYEELDPIILPSESLQKCIFHSEDWLDQFETVNTIRRLVKYNPEVFLSKVTLHNIVLSLVKGSDSLRSSLSKNSLIGLKEMCETLGKAADGEISDILKIFLKKASDTNTFLSETALEGLDALTINCSEGKILLHLVIIAENARNPAIKSKLMYCITKIIQKTKSGILKLREINKALQYIYEYLSDANSDVRCAAKQAYEILIENIPDESHLEIILHQDIHGTTFKKIKKAVKKKSKVHTEKIISLSKKESSLALPSLVKSSKNKIILCNSAREISEPLPTFDPDEFKKIEEAEANILDMEWKIRYEAITTVSDLIKTCMSLLISSNKLINIMEIIQKGLIDTNLKVLFHSLTLLVKIIPILKKRVENYLSLIVDPLLISLGSTNTSIKDTTWDACILITLYANKELLLPLFINSLENVTQRGRASVLTLIINLLPGIKDAKLLEIYALPVTYKFIDDAKLDVRNESGRLLVALYKILGNLIVESAPTNKLHKVISLISKELD